jgi:hypothetical protein
MPQLIGLLVFVTVGLAVLWGKTYFESYEGYRNEIRQFLREEYCNTGPSPIPNVQPEGGCNPNSTESLIDHGYDFGVEDALMNMDPVEFEAQTGLSPYQYPQRP